MSSYENFKRSLTPGFPSANFNSVVGLITTTPLGVVLSNHKIGKSTAKERGAYPGRPQQ